MSVLGLDIGTTTCKGAAYSADGRRLALATEEYSVVRPQNGWAELDSQHVIDTACEIIRRAAQEARQAGDPIHAMAVSAFGESMTPVSRDRKILGNAILHSDIRGRAESDAWLARFSPEKLYVINPNIVSPAFSLPKLLWMQKHAVAVFDKADRFLLFGELLFYLLGCDAVTSYSHANRTLLFDLKRQQWSQKLLDAAGIDAAKLPSLAPSGTIAGTLGKAAAESLGLEPGVTCVVGAHDQCSNALGVGIYAPGQAVDGVGTVECITPVFEGIPDEKRMFASGLSIEHHAVPGLYVTLIFNQAGSLVQWHRNTFAAQESAAACQSVYDRLTAEMPDRPTRLLVLPHFEPTGVPSCIRNTSGVILGLHTSTTRGEILKAIMECETFFFFDVAETLARLGVKSKSYIASGGGAKSDRWLQIKADVMGVPYERASETEAGALGVAMIAAKATGVVASYEEAAKQWLRPGRIFEPDSRRHAFYQEKFERYRQLYPRLHDILEYAGGDDCD